MPDVTKDHEREHLANLKAQEAQLTRLYEAAIDRIYIYATGLQLAEGEVFSIANYPMLAAAIDREVATLAQSVQVLVENGIQRSFELSQRKIQAQVNATYYQNRTMDSVVQEMLARPQGAAMDQFAARKVNGLGLSDRVWKYADAQIRAEIEQNLFAGIAEGRSAAEMARDQKVYLKNPDALFRRVRDAKGVLRLSKRAKEFDYHKDPNNPNKKPSPPGKGLYRSAYKNALRLTITETNMAYRSADVARYRVTPFITGYRVSLSASHPTFDICDYLAGEYPLEFEWAGWHPQCICYVTPIMPDMAEFLQYQQALLSGEGDKFEFKKVVTDVPEAFKDYVEKNGERMSGWKRLPMWLAQNRKFTPVAA